MNITDIDLNLDVLIEEIIKKEQVIEKDNRPYLRIEEPQEYQDNKKEIKVEPKRVIIIEL